MNREDLKYEDKPVFEPGEKVFCTFENRDVVIYSRWSVEPNLNNEFIKDFDDKDLIGYNILMDGSVWTGYTWWDFDPKTRRKT